MFPVKPFPSMSFNNSLKVKIEIEHCPNGGGGGGNNNLPKFEGNSNFHLDRLAYDSTELVHRLPHSRGSDTEPVTAGRQFANNIYSELEFEQRRHEQHTNSINYTQQRIFHLKSCYDPRLNYENSATALKEQIARAKAKFFGSHEASNPNNIT